MSVAFLGEVLKRARTHLNDDDANNWPDPRLLRKAHTAFEELEAELILAGIPIISSQSVVITVPPYDINAFGGAPLDISTLTGYPNDMILPIWMKEKLQGELFRDFVDMIECDFIPNTTTDVYLRYWAWSKNTVTVLGALNPIQVQLRYQRFLPSPNVNTDSISVPLGQLFLAPRIAALAFDSVGNRQARVDLTQMAKENLDKIVRMNIKQLQNMPAKRRPYHRGAGRNRVLRDF